VQAWRVALEAEGLAPARIQQKLSTVRKLAAEASYNGLLDPATAQAIQEVRGPARRGVFAAAGKSSSTAASSAAMSLSISSRFV
jgi:hypothetical protein